MRHCYRSRPKIFHSVRCLLFRQIWKEAANVAWHISCSLSQLLHSSLTGKSCLWPIFLLGSSLGCAQVWIPFVFCSLTLVIFKYGQRGTNTPCYWKINSSPLSLSRTSVCLHKAISEQTNWQIKYNTINSRWCFSAVITTGSSSKEMSNWLNRKKKSPIWAIFLFLWRSVWHTMRRTINPPMMPS